MAAALLESMIPPRTAPAFLAANGWAGATIEPLAGDASFRRYFRVLHEGRSAVLMDAPPPHEDPGPFAAIADYLSGIGLTPPPVLARDLQAGLLLLGDFGDRRLRETLDTACSREDELYSLATDVLVHLHGHPPMAGLKPHGLDQWLDELMLFPDWYAPAVGLKPDREEFRALWRAALTPVAGDGLGPVTVLRDYHAENIMLLDGRVGIAHFGLLDFQDALMGHPAYDLCSVLEDARRDVSPDVERRMIDRYRTATGADERFEVAYWALAAQRNTRIIGVFTRLWKRDGKPHYMDFQERMWGLLERDLAHSGLSELRDWFNANVPAEKRRSSAWA